MKRTLSLSSRHGQRFLLSLALAAVAILTGVSAHAQYPYYPNGGLLSYPGINFNFNNVLTPAPKIVLAYWGRPSDSTTYYAAAALSSGNWSTFNMLTQYYDLDFVTTFPPHVQQNFVASPAASGVSEYFFAPGPTMTPTPTAEEASFVDYVYSQFPGQNIVVFVVYPSGYVSSTCSSSGCHTNTSASPPYHPYVVLNSGGLNPWTVFHEMAETLTDPYISASQPAWQDYGASSGAGIEIGDVCEYSDPGQITATETRRFQLLPSSMAPYNILSLSPLMSNASNQGAGYCVYAYSARSDSFVLGTDLKVYHSQDTTGTWSTWGGIPSSVLVTAPAAASYHPNNIDIFGTSLLGDMWHTASVDGGVHVNAWDNWSHPTGYLFTGRPTVASWGAYRLDVYSRAYASGNFNYIFHRFWDNGTYGSWTQIPTPFTVGSTPAATSWGPGDVELVVLDTSGNLWIGQSGLATGEGFSWTNYGTSPVGFGFDLTASPAVGSHDFSTLDVFATNATPGGEQLTHFWCTHSCMAISPHGWDNQGGQQAVMPGTGPAIVGRGDQRFTAEYTGSDGSLWQVTYNFGYPPSWTKVLSSPSITNYGAALSAW